MFTKVKGQNCGASKVFNDLNNTLEWYNICALHQHGSMALLNKPQKAQEHLATLKTEDTKS